jgi:prepilin-type N-terminal cleavage/methylation domain-containing protein
MMELNLKGEKETVKMPRLILDKNEFGFTLIESLMAISILAIVVVQILNVQAASITVTQSARDNMRSTWALRSTLSQIEYAIDSVGTKAMPKSADFVWSGDPNFKINVTLEDTPIEASKLLSTAMKLGASQGGGAEAEEGASKAGDTKGDMKEMAALLDAQIPKDLYRTAAVKVTWQVGDKTRSAETGMLLVDTSQANLMSQLSNIPGLGGDDSSENKGTETKDNGGKDPGAKGTAKPNGSDNGSGTGGGGL